MKLKFEKSNVSCKLTVYNVDKVQVGMKCHWVMILRIKKKKGFEVVSVTYIIHCGSRGTFESSFPLYV